MNTLISADNTWALLSIMCVSVAIAIWLEQKYAWAAKISGAILALIGGRDYNKSAFKVIKKRFEKKQEDF